MPSLRNFVPSTGIGLFDASLENRTLNIRIKLYFANRRNVRNYNLVEKKIPTITEPWQEQYEYFDPRSKQGVKPAFKVDIVDKFEDAHYSVGLADWDKTDTYRNNIDGDPDSIDTCYADPKNPLQRLRDDKMKDDFI